ncbi:ABC transporter permease [Aureimonas fodinaquatilis]|uniref:ABC transporter permease n=2 Tax=Aureimonas fodinaquatilis TaxID=2565783 RepID=A0A5B0DSU4_9HYPH|nr:ABC transporter permease [Aureimonas fodinaquatilis]
MAVIAIMTFLASLTLGSVLLVADTSASWQRDIARELTVQIRPEPGMDMDAATTAVQVVLLATPGVVSATPLDDAAANMLLSPWLGDLDLTALPVPRLIAVEIDLGSALDFAALEEAVERAVPQASLDDHRAWISRLAVMAGAMVTAGVAILALVLAATVLTVVFATRGAMTGNRHIIEVLHFVGASGSFIAGQFQRHFLRLGLIGAAIGGAIALVLFLLVGWSLRPDQVGAEADQFRVMFGTFNLGIWGYSLIVMLALAVAVLTALTSRFTVLRQLAAIDLLAPVDG